MELPEIASITFESAEKLILQWDASDSRGQMIFDGDRDEINEYLQAVDVILRWMELNTESDNQNKVYKVIGLAMERLEDEFANILTGHTSPRYSTCSSSLTDITNYELQEDDYLDYASPSEHEIDDLRSIAIRMNSAGYLRQCAEAYRRVRKAILDLRFQLLGVEKLSINGVQRLEWEVLEAKIKQWIRAAKVCVRILFTNEKQLSQQIFEGLQNVADLCFMETIKEAAIQLFDFVDAISSSRRSVERMFRLLDLHRALSDIFPDVDYLFQLKSGEAMKFNRAVEVSVPVWAAAILLRVEEAVRGILSQLEKDVLQELTTILDRNGTVHSLTRYVTGYIVQMSDYKQSLTELIVLKPPTDLRYLEDQTIPDMDFMRYEERTPLELHLIWIIVILQFKLEVKSKQYKDASLAQVFMINNVHYIVQEIMKCPELKRMVGDDYFKKLVIRIRRAVRSYERSSWGRMLSCLSEESLNSFEGAVPVSQLNLRLKTFNSLFKDVSQTHVRWLIPDIHLREDLRLMIAMKLIQAYRTFTSRHLKVAYIKYSAEELENVVMNLFEGHNRIGGLPK